jgi:hypothetical protein
VHTSPVPQVVPSGTGVAVSVQVCVPVAQLVAPTSHGFAGVHAAPETQAMQAPALQTWSVPQAVPFVTGVPVSAQVCTPVAHEVVPTSHGFAGVHAAPETHALQTPASQTAPAPHVVPFATGVPVSTQAWTPVAHEVTPTSQAFAGVHAAPETHAVQAPALHTRSVPQVVPFATGVPVSAHVCTPVAHEVTPTSQAFAGVHAAPATHAVQAPALHTAFVPHEVPFATAAPVSVHVVVPLVQSSVPTWQGFATGHAVPHAAAWKSQVAVAVPLAPQSIRYVPAARDGPATGVPTYPRAQPMRLMP